MDFHQNTVSETDNDNQNNINNISNGDNQYNQSVENTAQNVNAVSGQTQMPHGNEGRYPYQNNSTPTYPNGSPYANSNGNPYYGNPAQGTNPAQGGNTGYNNTSYGNGGYNTVNNNYNYNNNCNNNGNSYNNNGYNPNYGRYAYPANVSEPGSKLATAAMILGIISIISCFTFTIYPAFITGSIAVVLALLSKGRRPKFLNNARIGIICAVIGLVSNVLLITGTIVRYYTDDDFRAQVNYTWEELYGQTLDEMIEEILEDSGYTD